MVKKSTNIEGPFIVEIGKSIVDMIDMVIIINSFFKKLWMFIKKNKHHNSNIIWQDNAR